MNGGKPASAVAPLKLRFADSSREEKKREIVLSRMSYTTFSFTIVPARVNETRCVFHMQNFTTRLQNSFFFYCFLFPLRPWTISIRRCAPVRAAIFRKRKTEMKRSAARNAAETEAIVRNYASPCLFNPVRLLIHTLRDITIDLSGLYYANNRRALITRE